MQLAGSQTLENIKTAFLGESQATIKYYIYGDIAKKDGYQEISGIFDNIAHNEYAHAQLLLSLISEGIPSDTVKALENAAGGEHYEWAEAYALFARTARDEGFDNIANIFDMIAAIEKDHEARFRFWIDQINNGRVFTNDGETVWICRNCGHIYAGTSAPQVCPVCKKPQAYFERKDGYKH